MPYYSSDLPMVTKVLRNAEIARSWDAYLNNLPGMLASINDVTDGSQNIPDYISATGVASIAFEDVTRRDVVTPYGSYGLVLADLSTGLAWYNNMLQGSRMQSFFGSTEAINVNGTEICPLTTWDSKITTVLAMLGGVGPIVAGGLKSEVVVGDEFDTIYDRFVAVVSREHQRVFGDGFLLGEDVPFMLPPSTIPDVLSDWKLNC